MNEAHGFDYYRRIIDSLEPGTLERYDREESGAQCFGADEATQGGGAFTFSALCRDDQVAILRALDVNLPTKTKRVNHDTGTSYAIKHAVERYTGRYTSNLQAKVAMRLLGYKRSSPAELNPHFNISRREWRAFSELSLEMDARRRHARERMARQEEQQAAARYFYRMTKTA